MHIFNEIRRKVESDFFPELTDQELYFGVKTKTSEEVISEIEEGGNVSLTQDLYVEGKSLVISNPTTLDLNGKSITSDGSDDGWGLVLEGAGKVTIKNGTIYDSEASNNDLARPAIFLKGETELTLENVTLEGVYGVWTKGTENTVTINSGNFLPVEGTIDCPMVYVQEGGKVTINGGTFGKPGVTNNFLLNLRDAIRKETDPVNFLEVKGGKFYNFDPANNRAEGAGTTFVPAGYVSGYYEENGDKIYIVRPEGDTPEEIEGHTVVWTGKE